MNWYRDSSPSPSILSTTLSNTAFYLVTTIQNLYMIYEF